ncbi:hypothetical protein AU381_21885 [Sinorhizobium glycinis]|uniref:Uncharacterized protein n=1 Tax=Sinorhizobium glycinis TaxID=1472378 RepID=A0A178XSQ9_9HYPH|nr:hypothetical protein AU381_21885 [Sinorhizobium glycinis]
MKKKWKTYWCELAKFKLAEPSAVLTIHALLGARSEQQEAGRGVAWRMPTSLVDNRALGGTGRSGCMQFFWFRKRIHLANSIPIRPLNREVITGEDGQGRLESPY